MLNKLIFYHVDTNECPLAFCLFLIVWVWFFVPETRGVGIEEMDKLFGGSQGEADLQRMADIRQQLGIGAGSDGYPQKESDIGVSQIEHA